jgi:hypothetical protein
MLEYSRCQLGQKCIVKTDDNYVFRKFTLLVAISNSVCAGSKLYQQGGMTKEKFVDFLKMYLANTKTIVLCETLIVFNWKWKQETKFIFVISGFDEVIYNLTFNQEFVPVFARNACVIPIQISKYLISF